ncbi:MAG: endonuclease/exonuclease/phosphatase family protein [Verrucomicrobia bacterium]|nr:endonuclease/exonuclease/phosphatase family protein [Verrucomicrobiota bacterium]
MRPWGRISLRVVAWVAGAVTGGFLLSRYLNYHPRPVECEEAGNTEGAPLLSPDQPINAITFNVQFLAGTGYHFFYDGGPDTFVARSDIESTIAKVAALIAETNPDFVLFQEVDCGARRTAYHDEVALLRGAMPAEIRNHVSTFYWKSKFVPHLKIMGSVGTKLVIFSRYRLGKARRYQLPRTPGNPLERDFGLKRAILEVEIPLANGRSLVLLNTHLEAFPKGTDVMERQIQKLLWRLKTLDDQNLAWILGGDFNLLPPGQSARLNPQDRGIHREPAEIGVLYEQYAGVPTVTAATGKHMRHYFTFTRRVGANRLPVRTLDYFFASPKVAIEDYAVLQEGTMDLSDHLPLTARFRLRTGFAG